MPEFDALDATATKQRFSVTTDANGLLVGSSCATDPITGAKMQVGNQYANDNQTFSGNAALHTNIPLLWNGQGFDRQRGNVDAQTSLVTVNGAPASNLFSATQTNYNHRGVTLGINITQISASTSLQVSIQAQDVVSGQWYTILSSVAFTTVAFNTLTIYPGIAATANVAANTVLPRTFRVEVTITGSGTATATIGMSKLV